MPDGLTVAAFLLLLILLGLWARQRGVDVRREEVERYHALTGRVHDRLLERAEETYRERLRDETEATS